MDANDVSRIQRYLGIESSQLSRNLTDDPVAFLRSSLSLLPPDLLQLFSSLVSPKDRTQIAAIRNRRSKYTQTSPAALSWRVAKNEWPLLWHGRGPRGVDEGEEERLWASNEFLGGGRKPHVGNLGVLLADYEEEREAARVRTLRREMVEADTSLPEEDEESDLEEVGQAESHSDEPPTDEQLRREFERTIHERFIYGLLQGADYDAIDWDDTWDQHNREDDEDRWFNDEGSE